MKKSDISNISNAESVERAEESVQIECAAEREMSARKRIGYLVRILWDSTNPREALRCW
ncbi:MAG: hypothetical protein ACLUPW_00800 [Bifidobacterium pseudocatenulatum]